MSGWLEAIDRLVFGSLARSSLGKALAWRLMRYNVEIAESMAIGLLFARRQESQETTFSQVLKNNLLPDRIADFTDLDFLFWSNRLNFGIILMSLSEAAYVYNLARSMGEGDILEIGRFKGGLTFLLAMAAGNRTRVVSIDNHHPVWNPRGEQLDHDLSEILRRYGALDKVELAIADSATYDFGSTRYRLAVIDGDHTYEGVRKDFQNVSDHVEREGHLLFHDAGDKEYLNPANEGTKRFVEELRADGRYRVAGEVGTLVHFIRCA